MVPGTISQLAGVMTLAGSLLLIYLKRINLARAVGDLALKGVLLEAEVAKIISIKTGTPALGLIAIGLILEIHSVIVFYRDPGPWHATCRLQSESIR